MTHREPGRGQYRVTHRGTTGTTDDHCASGSLTTIGAFTIEAGEGVRVTALETPQVSLCLLGSVVDYSQPRRPIREALAETAASLEAGGVESAAVATRFLGGRWLLLWHALGRTYAFQDPTGMMRLFHMGSGDSMVVGSDPSLICDDESFSLPAAAYAALVSGEYWWPGPVSPMPGLRQLLPNHYLCLNDCSTTRCWPMGALPRLSLAEATSRCSELLMNGIAGLDSLPQGLCLGLTAGVDTRVLLAATRSIADRCEYFTFRYATMSHSHDDPVVATRLARRFGLSFTIIDTPPKMSDCFAPMYRSRVIGAHSQWGPLAEAMLHSPLAPRLLLKGCPGLDSFRDAFGSHPDESVDPAFLRELGKLPDIDSVNQSLAEWHRAALSWQQRDPDDIRLDELFYWEQRLAGWQAMSQEEYGLVQESFSPFNCRAVCETLLGLGREYRGEWDWTFPRELVRAMWPELLRIPINPSKVRWQTNVRLRLRKGFPRAHAYYKHVRGRLQT